MIKKHWLVAAFFVGLVCSYLGAQGSVSMSAPPSLATVGTSNVTTVASSVQNVVLLSANPSRRGGIITNVSGFPLFFKLGVGAAPSSFTKPLVSGESFPLPLPVWTGEIDGFWTGVDANGAMLTELTP